MKVLRATSKETLPRLVCQAKLTDVRCGICAVSLMPVHSPPPADGFDLLHLQVHQSEAANGSYESAAGSFFITRGQNAPTH